MKKTILERRAQLLRLYTGLPWQSARRRVEVTSPGSALIPQPDQDQLMLESSVMAALAWRQITTLHPWGIKYVDPRSDRLLIHFETVPAELRGSDETQAMDLAQKLLPRADEYGEIHGVPGARAHTERGRVVVRTVGTSASITLLGLDPDEWLRAVAMQDRAAIRDGMTLCHRDQPAQWHPAERPYRRREQEASAASAWLSSGLLRRAGLIRTLGVPLAMTGWVGHHERGGERWIIDPTFVRSDGPGGHRRLLAFLAAPAWGLPVVPVAERCGCHLPPGYTDQCTTIATCPTGRPGVLEVRAIGRRGEALARIQQDRPAVYAAQQQIRLRVPAWIDRWVER
ncbi:hypothetical protein AB0N79_35620 [Streptomyces microflavus]|uniref:hypothetical protein n=1 Tax=Streptomyces microflavus TaxID=1919 RepID=UPI00341E3B8E